MRSRPTRVSVRRPSSTAATICAARAAPIPGMRRSSSYRARASRSSPPTAVSTALARSSALAFARPWPRTTASSSLSPSAVGAHALQLLARAIVRRDALHRTPSLLYFRPDAPRCCPAVSSLPLRRLLRATAERNRSSAGRHRHRARGRRRTVRGRGIRGSHDRAPAGARRGRLSATIASRCRARSTPASGRRKRRAWPRTARREHAATPRSPCTAWRRRFSSWKPSSKSRPRHARRSRN